MTMPPYDLNDAEVLCYVTSVPPASGQTVHREGDAILPPPAALAICQYEYQAGFYLFYCDAEWEVQADTCHPSLEEAKAQAEFEFPGATNCWVDAVLGRTIDEMVAAREKLNLTQGEVADQIGLSFNWYYDVETYPGDVFLLELDIVIRILRVLKLPVRHFLRGVPSAGNQVRNAEEYIALLRPRADAEFEDQVGWILTPALESPENIWKWCLDQLIAVSEPLEIDWLTFLDHATKDLTP